MKATNEGTGHNRNILLTEIPGGILNNLRISVTYHNDSPGRTIDKAVCLDNVVIPAILNAINSAPKPVTLTCGGCRHIEVYHGWDDYMAKQLNSVPYCPKCGKPCDGATQ